MVVDHALRWSVRGPHRVVGRTIERWAVVDDLPVAVYAQVPHGAGEELLPVVLLAHGLGGDHLAYGLLGAHLASHGYAVLHPQFLDSRRLLARDRETREEADLVDLRPMLFDPAHWRSRVARARAVLDSLADQAHLPVTLQPTGVTAMGHSFGAFTTQSLIGVRLFGVGGDLEDARHPAVGSAVLLSPQGSGDRGLTEHSWDEVQVPLLAITASRDLGPHGEGLTWRRECYDRSPAPVKHLAVARLGDHFLGGVHLAEAGPDPFDGRYTPAPELRRAVDGIAAAFLDAVRGDGDAAAWLSSHPYPAVMDHEHRELVP